VDSTTFRPRDNGRPRLLAVSRAARAGLSALARYATSNGINAEGRNWLRSPDLINVRALQPRHSDEIERRGVEREPPGAT
jgi:hypothetical protein